MTTIKFSGLIMYFLVIFGCNTKAQDTENIASEAVEKTDAISAKDIDNLKFTDYILSADSQNVVSDWQKYLELSSQMEFLKKGDLSFVNGEKALLKVFINELKTEIPDVLNTQVIQSRLTALETKVLKLNSIISLDNISKIEQLKNIKEFLIASAHLNLQINKKLELDANNISRPE